MDSSSSGDDSEANFDKLHFDELLSVLNKIKVYVDMVEQRLANEDITEDPKLLEGAKLRDYQRKGLRWILTLYENGMNGILADEMGLGKTVQVISALASLVEAGVSGPFLIIVPLSVLSVWADQLAAFAPRLPCVIYYGALSDRVRLRKKMRKRVRVSLQGPVLERASIADTSSQYNASVCSSTKYDQLSSTIGSICSFTQSSTASSLDCQGLCFQIPPPSGPEVMCVESVFHSVSQAAGQSVDDFPQSRTDCSVSCSATTDVTSMNPVIKYSPCDRSLVHVPPDDNVSTLPDHSFKCTSDLFIGLATTCLEKVTESVDFSSTIYDVDKSRSINAQSSSTEPKPNELSLTCESPSKQASGSTCPNEQFEESAKWALAETRDILERMDSSESAGETQPKLFLSCTVASCKSSDCVPENYGGNSGCITSTLRTHCPSINSANPLTSTDPGSLIEPKLLEGECIGTMNKTLHRYVVDEPRYHVYLKHLDEVISDVITNWKVENSVESLEETSSPVPKCYSPIAAPTNKYEEQNVATIAVCATSLTPHIEPNDKIMQDDGMEMTSIGLSASLDDTLPSKPTDTKVTGELAMRHIDDIISEVLIQRPENVPTSLSECSNGDVQQCSANKKNHRTVLKQENDRSGTLTVAESEPGDLHFGTSGSIVSHKSECECFWAYPVVLTTYETAIRDSMYLKRISFKALIVDEGQRLKNPVSRLYRRLSKFQAGLRLLLTGTPLQNRISELWALLHFILPEIFTSLEMFEHWFDPVVLGESSGRERLLTAELERCLISKLHCIISPFMLRRTKSETNLLLPPKREILLRVRMTKLQEKLYKQALELCVQCHGDRNKLQKRPNGQGSLTWLDQANVITTGERGRNASKRLTRQTRRTINRGKLQTNSSEQQFVQLEDANSEVDFLISPRVSINNGLMLLRRIVNHPYLAIEVPDEINPEELIAASEKTRMLDRLLNHLIQTKHKVLIFSQLTIILDIIVEVLDFRSWPYVRLDGSTKFEDRQSRIRRFNSEPVESLPVFLVSARAGGCGLNLQAAADTVILFDSDWNPQTDLQAQDRCHRIGQTQPVLVIRLVTANSIDETILRRAQTKRGLERLVLARRPSNRNAGCEKSPSVNRRGGRSRRGWVDERIRDHLSTESNPHSNLSKTEILGLLNQTDFDRELSDVEQLWSDEALHSLLDRSELHRLWQEQQNEQGCLPSDGSSSQNANSDEKVVEASVIDPRSPMASLKGSPIAHGTMTCNSSFPDPSTMWGKISGQPEHHLDETSLIPEP